MAKGMSLHIGINEVDPAYYYGSKESLANCERSAGIMQRIAASAGFEAIKLLTTEATRTAVRDTITGAAGKLKSGDTFLLTASCHGDHLPNRNRGIDGNPYEPDLFDELWMLYDGKMIDDELNDLLAGFSEGVKIVVVADSCYSGTIVEKFLHSLLNLSELALKMHDKASYENLLKTKSLLKKTSAAEWQEKLFAKTGKVKASGLLISAAQDNENAYDGDFTDALVQIWNDGKFNGFYPEFRVAIADILLIQHRDSVQHPNYFLFGNKNSEQVFKTLKPFNI